LLAGLSADFKNKIRICESEASETQYWLEVIVETEWLSWDKVKPEHEEWNCLLFLHLLEKNEWRNDCKLHVYMSYALLNFRHFSSL
jgi:hypothetical protein